MSSLILRQDAPQLALGNMSSLDFSNLQSLFQAGAQLASEQLSILFQMSFVLELTGLHTLPFAWLLQQISDDKRLQTSVRTQISGDLRGDLYLFLSRNSARNLAQTGLKQRGVGSLFLNPLEESVINEFTNILVNTFWLTFNDRLPLHWWLTPPSVLHHPVHALMSAEGLSTWERLSLLVEFHIVNTTYDLTLFFLPTGDDLDNFLSRLRGSE